MHRTVHQWAEALVCQRSLHGSSGHWLCLLGCSPHSSSSVPLSLLHPPTCLLYSLQMLHPLKLCQTGRVQSQTKPKSSFFFFSLSLRKAGAGQSPSQQLLDWWPGSINHEEASLSPDMPGCGHHRCWIQLSRVEVPDLSYLGSACSIGPRLMCRACLAHTSSGVWVLLRPTASTRGLQMCLHRLDLAWGL